MKFILMLSLICAFVSANEDLKIEEEFLEGIEEISEIATKTKLNIDDSPSLVTVLRHEKLRKLGINNVYEALGYVPGVQLKREASGVPVVVFRGVSQKGEVKLMIDGVTINNSYRGSIYYYLNFPIELVERIEVIRGAGSVLYGSGAISGEINIITKIADEERSNDLFLSAGKYDTYSGGAVLTTDVGGMTLSLDAYYHDSQKILDATDRHLKDYSAGMKLKSEYIELLARLKKSDQGNAYGILGNPDRDKERYFNQNESIFTQLSFKRSLGEKERVETIVGFNRYTQDIQSSLDMKSVVLPALSAYREDAYYAQADFYSKRIDSNELLLGVRVERSKAKRSKLEIGGRVLPPVANADSKRDTISAYINDQYSLSSAFDISAGFRFDDYSDFGNAASPTVGAIYRINKNFRLKMLYAKAYRAPSWVELTSNPSLQAETSDSFEGALIYKNHTNSTFRLNVYKTRIDDLITRNSERKYVQTDYADFFGGELEYIFIPTDDLEVNLFGSYVDAEDQNGDDLAGIAEILAAASVVYDFDFGLSWGSLVKYVSNMKRDEADTREDVPDSVVLDQTFSYKLKDLTLFFIIKDLFDKGVYYALPSSKKYGDFYDGGRSFYFKFEWEF